MHSTLEFLVNHGYLVLLIWVFLEQAGLPLPSIPLLLAAGALGGMHRLDFGTALLLCILPRFSPTQSGINSAEREASGFSTGYAGFRWSRTLA